MFFCIGVTGTAGKRVLYHEKLVYNERVACDRLFVPSVFRCLKAEKRNWSDARVILLMFIYCSIACWLLFAREQSLYFKT